MFCHIWILIFSLQLGESVKPINEAIDTKKISPQKYINAEGLSPHEVHELIKEYFEDRTIFGFGNIHGGGEELLEIILHEGANPERGTVLQSA